MTLPRFDALVIGLGRVGSRFDEEPGRQVPWSHVGAYLARQNRFRLVGGVDIDAENTAAFRRRCPDVPVFAQTVDAVRTTQPQVVSICTPAALHRPCLEWVLAAHRPRLVWCEKPLAENLGDAEAMVSACAAAGVALLVTYNRFWSPLWQALRTRIAAGEIGPSHLVRVAMPNRLYSVGSHGVSLLSLLGGAITAVVGLPVPALDEGGEPAVAGMVRFAGGGYGILEVTGRKADLLVEAEVIGTCGRLTAREISGEIVAEQFVASANFAGYRTLAFRDSDQLPTAVEHSAFLACADDIVSTLDGLGQPACPGILALEIQRVVEALRHAPHPPPL